MGAGNRFISSEYIPLKLVITDKKIAFGWVQSHAPMRICGEFTASPTVPSAQEQVSHVSVNVSGIRRFDKDEGAKRGSSGHFEKV